MDENESPPTGRHDVDVVISLSIEECRMLLEIIDSTTFNAPLKVLRQVLPRVDMLRSKIERAGGGEAI